MPPRRRQPLPSPNQWDLFALLDKQAPEPTPARREQPEPTAADAAPAGDGSLFAFAQEPTPPAVANAPAAPATTPAPVAAADTSAEAVPAVPGAIADAAEVVPAVDYAAAATVEPPAGRAAQAADNLAALAALRMVQAASRPATNAEQEALARWRGWGGLPHIFDAPADSTDADYWRTRLASVTEPLLSSLQGRADAAAAEAVSAAVAGGIAIDGTGPQAARALRQAARDLPKPGSDTAAERIVTDVADALRAAAHTAEWAPQRAELNGLTDERERAAAARSSLTAYYTDPIVTGEIWRALEGLGFTGGPVLEPGCGVGQFIGQAPASADMVGVELDPTTSVIAASLYPSADIVAGGFEGPGWNEGAFTAALGNVPFGNFKLYDPQYNGRGLAIHNHFLLKAVKLTAPGGIVAAITSAYTMDAKSPTARRAIHQYADLVGAVRLPSGAFDGAGTQVVTDLVILRRRMDGEVAQPISVWEQTVDVATPAGKVAINRYFAEHRDHVLGTLTAGKSAYGDHVATTIDGPGRDSIGAALRAQLDTIVARAHSNGLALTVDAAAPRPAPHEQDMGSWEQSRKPGTIRARQEGGFERLDPASRTWQPHKVAKSHATETRALLELRDAVGELLAAARTAEPEERAAARAHAMGVYEKYVTAYGPIGRYSETTRAAWVLVSNVDEADIDPEWETRQRGADKGKPEVDDAGEPVMQVRRETQVQVRPAAIEALRSDPGFAAVLAVEVFDDETQTASPAAVLTRDVVTPASSARQVETAADALAVVLDRTGVVDINEIAALIESRPSTAETRDMLGDLVFNDPTAPGELVPAARYLSGHIRSKLAKARPASVRDPATYSRSVAALEAVLPAPLGPADIEVRPGVTWIEPSDYKAFIAEVLDVPDATVKWDQIEGSWHIDADTRYSNASRHTYGTEALSGADLLGHLMNNQPTTVTKTVTDYEGRERLVPDADATELANAKKSALADRFARWVWANPERAERLADVYNDRFNSFAAPHYSGAHLTFPGIGSQYEPRPTQAAAVARIIDQPTVLLDHVVGAGKTGTMVMAAMELRRLGLARQPWIVVPNHLVEQVAREAKQWYPDAEILAGAAGSDAKARRELVALTATGEYDMVVIPESTFTGIPVSADTQAAYIADQVAELETAISERKEASGGGRGSASRRLEIAKQNLETKLQTLRGEGRAGRDTGLTFESSGCDYLLVDEAHHYKNRMVISHTRDLARGQDSQRALDLALKLRVLRQARADEGRPERIATFATGTPIANSPREMWVMLDYLRPDLLAAAGVDTFDAWAQNHLRPQTRLEMKPTGAGFAPKTRVTGFVNVPEMSQMWRQAADLVTRDDLPVTLPTMTGGTRQSAVIPRSPEQADYAADLERRVEAIKTRRVEPDEDNMLLVSSDGRRAALDQRLVGLPASADGGKPTAIAANIMRIHRDHETRQYLAEDGSTSPVTGALQIVFLDQSTPHPGQWNLYRQIKTELVAAGMGEAAIRFIHDAPPGPSRTDLFQACREGRVSVLIGSTPKLGTGANIQTRLAAIHHADVPWRPDFLEQREGRAIRQGNQNGEVEICTYVAENTFDAYSWNLIAVKAGFISQIKNGTTARHVEVDDDNQDNFELIAAVSSGDPRIVRRHQLGIDLAALERLDRAWAAEQRGLAGQVRGLTRAIADLPGIITEVQQVAARVTPTAGDDFSIRLLDSRYDERAAAGRALHHHVAALFNSTGRVIARSVDEPLGTLGGLTLRLTAVAGQDHTTISIDELTGLDDAIPSTMTIEPAHLTATDGTLGLGLIRRAENLVASIPERAAGLADRLHSYQQRLAELKALADTPFEKAEQLATMRAEVRALDADLAKPTEPENLDPPPPAWLAKLPAAERDQLVWGPRLHRINPDGAITVADLQEGDILAAANDTSAPRRVTDKGGYGATSTLTLVDIASGHEVEQRKRDSTVVGIVARRRDNLDGIEPAIAASSPGDQIIRIDEVTPGDTVTICAARIDTDGRLSDDPFAPLRIEVAAIGDEPEPVPGKRFTYRPNSYLVATSADGTRYAIAARPSADRAVKHAAVTAADPARDSAGITDLPEATTTGTLTVTTSPEAAVHHGDDGTIVTGTRPDDVELADTLKANGFDWSPAQGFWYLPRTWETPTRALAVTRLTRDLADLGRAVPVVADDGPGRPAASTSTHSEAFPSLSLALRETGCMLTSAIDI